MVVRCDSVTADGMCFVRELSENHSQTGAEEGAERWICRADLLLISVGFCRESGGVEELEIKLTRKGDVGSNHSLSANKLTARISPPNIYP